MKAWHAIKCIPFFDKFCGHCDCLLGYHEFAFYKLKRTKNTFLDIDTAKLVGNADDANNYDRTLADYRSELENEQDQITEVCAKFSCFLKNNSITVFNDAMDQYLQHCIKVEKGKENGGNEKTLEGIQRMMTKYQSMLRLFDTPSNKENVQLKPDTIKELIRELYKMKHMGQMMKEIMVTIEEAYSKSMTYTEVDVYIPSKLNIVINRLLRLFNL